MKNEYASYDDAYKSHQTQPELRARSKAIVEHATGFRLAVQVQDEAAAVEHYSQLRHLID